MTNKESLYHWMFHYNHYTELWSAFQRKDCTQYFDNPTDPDLIVIKSKDVNTVVNILYKIGGDESKIMDL
jgi:hypothetical protein